MFKTQFYIWAAYFSCQKTSSTRTPEHSPAVSSSPLLIIFASTRVAEEIDKNQKIAARKPARNSAPSFVLESFSFVCFPVGLIFNISFHIVGRLSRPPQVLQLSQGPRAPVRGVNVHTTELLRTNTLIKCYQCWGDRCETHSQPVRSLSFSTARRANSGLQCRGVTNLCSSSVCFSSYLLSLSLHLCTRSILS